MPPEAREPRFHLARGVDAGAYAAHFQRHVRESGRSDVPHFSPVEDTVRSDVVYEAERRWATPLMHPGWGRHWLVWEAGTREPAVVAHVALRGPYVPSGMHRASLSIGVERPYARRGLGSDLLRFAIRHARVELELEYLDLQVFSTNAPAQRLYERLGFTVVGVVPDAYRVAGGELSVDDVHMALTLRT